jgi:HSP20 family molecular chaperone IbpA
MTADVKNDKVKTSYKLKVNINGFKLEDIKVIVEDVPNRNGKENVKTRVKISANRSTQSESHTNGQENTSISKEYVKYHDLSSNAIKHYNINLKSMKYYLDSKNPTVLVVEFESNSNENFYVSLDDSCESLVELAARSLINVKSLENLREVIQDPFNTKLDTDLVDIFSPTLIRDLNLATSTSFTPMKIESDSRGNNKIRLDVLIPKSIRTATLVVKGPTDGKQLIKYVDANHDADNMNCINLRVEGLQLYLEAITSSEDTTSSYSKQFKLPKGTDVDKINYKIDENKHSLIVEAPIRVV